MIKCIEIKAALLSALTQSELYVKAFLPENTNQELL